MHAENTSAARMGSAGFVEGEGMFLLQLYKTFNILIIASLLYN